MKIFLMLLLSLALCASVWPQIHVQVEPADTTHIKKPGDTPGKTGLVDAMKMDAVTRTAELQLRSLARHLTPEFTDDKIADSARAGIADVMTQEMIALWDFQIERALQNHDTALLSAMQVGLAELSHSTKVIQAKIKLAHKKMDKLMEQK